VDLAVGVLQVLRSVLAGDVWTQRWCRSLPSRPSQCDILPPKQCHTPVILCRAQAAGLVGRIHHKSTTQCCLCSQIVIPALRPEWVIRSRFPHLTTPRHPSNQAAYRPLCPASPGPGQLVLNRHNLTYHRNTTGKSWNINSVTPVV